MTYDQVKPLTDKLRAWLVPVLILLNLAITLPLAYRLNIWGDEAYTLHTTASGLGHALRRAIHFELQAPLYFALLNLWRKLDGSIFWARLFSVAAIALTIKIAYELARRFFRGVHPGWLAAAVAFHPFSIWAALEIRVYALVILLSALLLLLFFEGYLAEKDSRHARLLYMLVSVLALYTHYYLGFLLVANALALLALRRRRALLSYLLSMIPVASCFAPMLVVMYTQLVANTQGVAKPVSLLEAARVISWRVQEYILPAEWEPLKFSRRWAMRLGLAGALVYLALRKRKRIEDNNVAVWTIFMVLCALYFVALLLTEEALMQSRHTAALFVPSLLVVFSVVASVRSKKVLIGWALLSAIFYALFLYNFYSPLAKTGDWQRVAAFITASEKADQPVLVFRASAQIPLAFYYRGRNTLVPVPREWRLERFDQRDDVLANEEEVRRALASHATGEHNDVWLVTDETCRSFEIDFRCDVLEEFVSKNYEVVTDRPFFGARVRQLRRKPNF